MSQFALVSTVDSIGDGFPSHCVFLFDSEKEAIEYAVELIVQYDDAVGTPPSGGWTIDGEHYDNASDFLDEWQSKLDSVEYFHVKPVRVRSE